jgi:hypothetical protein
MLNFEIVYMRSESDRCQLIAIYKFSSATQGIVYNKRNLRLFAKVSQSKMNIYNFSVIHFSVLFCRIFFIVFCLHHDR